MPKKGKIAEIISNAIYHETSEVYVVGYLDFDTVREIPLQGFLKLSENFQLIPATRIEYIKKGEKIIYSKRKLAEGGHEA